MKFRLRIPIAFKLIVVTLVLLLAATIPIAFKSSEDFANASRANKTAETLQEAKGRAEEVEALLVSYVDKIKVVAALILQKQREDFEKKPPVDGTNPEAQVQKESDKEPLEDSQKDALYFSFHLDRDLVSVEVYEKSKTQERLVQRVVNESYLSSYNLDKGYIEALRRARRFPSPSVFGNNIEIRNGSLPKGAPLITIGIPISKDDYGNITHIAIADVQLARIQKVFSTSSTSEVFLVDKEGFIIAHPKDEWVTSAYRLNEYPSVAAAFSMENQRARTKKVDFVDPGTQSRKIGAFSKTKFGTVVLAEASEDVILEEAQQLKRNAFYITGLVLSGALFFIFLFSMTLTSPIEKLVSITEEVSKGNFDVKASQTVSSRDEVGELATSFDGMLEGLRERDKVKNLFSKFHGSSVAEDMINRDISIGGSSKEVTVFFSDIRGFTAFSETRTPEEVVTMLNEYFGVMVSIITKHKGIVDKFIGDAIMAVWGAPESTDRDAQNALQACLEMRKALHDLNEQRKSRGEVPIKIGMGLHSGQAISGTIGSDERMEYTVIGDTVNMASRIEASTKAFGSDLLVSELTANQVKEEFILEQAGAAEVKGKSEPLKLYKVRGFFDENKQPVIIRTEYSDYEAEKADKIKVAG